MSVSVPSKGNDSSFGELASDALRYWEPLRMARLEGVPDP